MSSLEMFRLTFDLTEEGTPLREDQLYGIYHPDTGCPRPAATV